MDLTDLLQKVSEQGDIRQGRDCTQPRDIQAEVLKDILSERQRKNPFQVGDLVEQINHLRRYRYPGEGQIAIVSDVITEPKPDPDSNTFDKNDMVVMCIVDTNEWIQFCVESWRFKKAEIAE